MTAVRHCRHCWGDCLGGCLLDDTRCQICHRTVAYRPGNLSEVLTEHYRRVHPEVLDLASR